MNYLKKYPKLLILLLTYLLAFFIFSFGQSLLKFLLSELSILGIFISGMMYSYAFTGGIATGSFIILVKSHSPILLSLIGGLGAGLSDVIIFKLLKKLKFTNELDNFSKEKIFITIHNKIPFITSKIFLNIAGIITLASPLPDELGVILIERGKHISFKYLFVLGLTANTLGIFILTNFTR